MNFRSSISRSHQIPSFRAPLRFLRIRIISRPGLPWLGSFHPSPSPERAMEFTMGPYPFRSIPLQKSKTVSSKMCGNFEGREVRS
jgi:hypothetical protein